MKKVITYGTFDLMHQGHLNILKRARALGDYLIVGVTSNSYDKERGKLNVQQSVLERVENVRSTGLADEILIEEYEGQKVTDIQTHDVNVFVIGSDWEGKFDYLREYCEVVYLERTRGISSTMLRENQNAIIRFGMIGNGRIARRFVSENRYVSGSTIQGVYNPNLSSAQRFANEFELEFATDSLEEFYSKIDAVYIATPHLTHADYIRKSLENGKHVLCEKPMVMDDRDLSELYAMADDKGLVLLEAVKTAFCPGFQHLMLIAKSGKIGSIKDVEATFTKLTQKGLRELSADCAGGSLYELGTYALLPIYRLLGIDYKKMSFYSYMEDNVDLFTKGFLQYENATASFKVGLGVKSEGDLIISGSKGYIYVPAPWWKTEYFEVRYENLSDTDKYFYKFEGEGLRYEILEFLQLIHGKQKESIFLPRKESLTIAKALRKYSNGTDVEYIK